MKALFESADFVLFDGPEQDKRREKAQESIQKVIKKGNYDWQTVNLDSKTGEVIDKIS